MRVQFYTPLDHPQSFTTVIEMPMPPRIGEAIMFEFDGPEYVACRVCWTPHEEDFDVYVSLR